jgi:hypothetical protein
MSKITANETHRWDDVADTAADAIRIALIDKTIISSQVNVVDYSAMAKELSGQQNKVNRLRKNAYAR